ncbi:MAG: polysaccharide deacetylase family protein [Actinobacteria bacterium]|nr:polysaccharide deacetylase family protein [Actinomycetota bacterium]
MLLPQLQITGPADGAVLGEARAADASFTARGSDAGWTLDGRDVTPRVVHGGSILSVAPLSEGTHLLVVRSRPDILGERRVRRVRFVVDRTAPQLKLPAYFPVRHRQPLVVRGGVVGAVRVSVGGRRASLARRRFARVLREWVGAAVDVVAVDAAGNSVRRVVRVVIEPRHPPVAVRAVHVTAYGWSDRTLRGGVMALIAAHRINTVELDLKDESGVVGFGSGVPLARRIGAAKRIYDLATAVRYLHARGVWVIGRLVCFRDPILAAAAWKAGQRDWVIQTPAGKPYAGYGGFTNFANPSVRRYQIDIALAAARAGIDDVLYDYVRRPDGPLASMSFPGLTGTPGSAIVGFLSDSQRALARYRTYLGASVFGVAATRPAEVAQPIRQMAAHLDYVAPMVYPSHWAPGEYGVADPNSEPYLIVNRALKDFAHDVHGTGARVVPWLQDFSLGRNYGPNDVRAQIAAARHDGINEYLLWDAGVTYTAAALTTDARALPNRRTPARGHAQKTQAPAVGRVSGLAPNELGMIPVLMHHQIRADRTSPYDQTPAEFRAELARLWRSGYWPVTAAALVERRLGNVPLGKTPVVLSFDDSTRYQLFFKNGHLVKDTAVGIMLAFAKTHPGFHATGTFYVLGDPWGGVKQGKAWLRWLVEHGFELGNHTQDHLPLRELNDAQVQRELALGARLITTAVPGYNITTMALPLGSMPHNKTLARHGRWRHTTYSNQGVFLVGANPAPSPYSAAWNPTEIPRIRSSHTPWHGESDYTAAYWLHELDAHPNERYVSDGDPTRISFPKAADALAVRFRGQAHAVAPR